jgi:hypothetical protein
MKHLLLLIGIILLIFISQVMLYLFPLYGLISTVIISGLFLFFAVYDIYDLAAEEIFAYASILPLLSLLSFSLPWLTGLPHEITFYFLLLLASELFYSFLPLRQKLYHSRSIIWLPLMILGGGILGLVLSTFSPHGTTPLLWGLLTILISSIGEAVYFQGLIQNATTLLTDNILGVLFTVFLYGFFHITTHFNNLGLILVYMLLGSLIYMKWKNMYLVMAFYLSFQLLYFLIAHSLFLSQ